MLAALGRGFEDETLRRAVEGWGSFMVEDGDRLRPEACQSPVWDTALAVLALRAAGVPADHPQLRKAGEWLLAEEVTVKGDWAIRRPDLAPGGWAFEFENDLYPDVDDTAVVALALRELGMGEDAVAPRPRLDRGHAVRERRLGRLRRRQLELLALQAAVLRLRLRDRPAERGRLRPRARGAGARAALRRRRVARGLDYLVREQQWDGSWWGRWGVNHVYGTGAALPALEACGFEPDHPAMTKAVDWLDSVQQADGGFGEDIASYHETTMRGRGAATRFTNGLGVTRLRRGRRGTERLGRRERPTIFARSRRRTATGREEHYTGTGFPTDFMIRYHLYRLHFPLMALGRLRERLNA